MCSVFTDLAIIPNVTAGCDARVATFWNKISDAYVYIFPFFYFLAPTELNGSFRINRSTFLIKQTKKTAIHHSSFIIRELLIH